MNNNCGLTANDKEVEQEKPPILRFSPTAWAKILYFRDKGDIEIGGFGISAADDPLYVTDFITVKQKVTAVSVSFDDEAVSRFFDDQVDLGRKPAQFARIWAHTHPADCPLPSGIDEDTFMRVFGGCDWAVMFILAEDNHSYARLTFNVGPGGRVLIPVEVDCSRDFGPSDRQTWDAEYAANIHVEPLSGCFDKYRLHGSDDTMETSLSDEATGNETLSADGSILDEFGQRIDPWDKESEVIS